MAPPVVQRSATARSATPLADAVNVVRHATVQARRADRGDLVERLRTVERGLSTPTSRVVVIGEFKKGKSSLVNALLGRRLCPTDPVRTTGVPTLIRFGEVPTGAVRLSDRPVDEDAEADPSSAASTDQPASGGRDEGDDAWLSTRTITLAELGRWVHDAPPSGESQVLGVEVQAPLPLLERGLVIVDTPPVGGGLASTHAAATLKALSGADATIFVSDTSQELTASEVELLERAARISRRIVCVLTKADFYPDWRLIARLNGEHLRRQGIDTDVVAVSSPLWHAALNEQDRDLARASGLPELTNWVRSVVLGGTEQRAIDDAARIVVTVVDQLESTARAERDAAADPRHARSMMSELELYKARAEALRGDASRWQQRLNDRMTDLMSDSEHDLGRRFMVIDEEATKIIQTGDPAELWADFEPWLYRRTNDDTVAHHTALLEQAQRIADEISELFLLEEEEILGQLPQIGPDRASDRLEMPSDVKLQKMGTREAGFTVVRGSASSMVITGMVGTFAAFLTPMAVPIAAMAAPVVAVALGYRALRGARDVDLEKRRREARGAYKKYLERARFSTTKESRDTMRLAHRNIRDHFTSRADEISRTASEDLQAVARGMKDDRETLKQRLAGLDRSIRQLRLIRAHAHRLAPAIGTDDGGR